MPELELLVTCEHGGHLVPAEYRHLFPPAAQATLASHRGFDAGALAVARALSARLGAPLIASETTRLLVDLNRSLRHPRLLSEYSRALAAADRSRLVAEHYTPYRFAVEQAVRAALGRGSLLLHVSSHSFTPSLDGVVRDADVGLLYDPRRALEAHWARRWQRALQRELTDWKIRRNYPYRGVSDGLTTHLRSIFPASRYAGIELEVNQRHVAAHDWPQRVARIAASLESELGSEPDSRSGIALDSD